MLDGRGLVIGSVKACSGKELKVEVVNGGPLGDKILIRLPEKVESTL